MSSKLALASMDFILKNAIVFCKVIFGNIVFIVVHDSQVLEWTITVKVERKNISYIWLSHIIVLYITGANEFIAGDIDWQCDVKQR